MMVEEVSLVKKDERLRLIVTNHRTNCNMRGFDDGGSLPFDLLFELRQRSVVYY